MTVHIVEDDAGVRDALSEFCLSAGRHVRTYSDGRSFQSVQDVKATDIVVIDLGLPDMNGVDVLRSTRKRDPVPKIIVISGLPKHHITLAMREFTDVPVVRKPLTDDLIGMLRRPPET